MDINLTLIYLFCSGLNLILGFIVLIKNFKSNANKSFFFLTLMQAFWIGSLYFLYFYINPYIAVNSFFFLKAAYCFSLLLAMSIPIFLYYFPKVTSNISKITKLGYLGISAIVIYITTFTPLVYVNQIIVNNEYVDDVFGPLYPIYLVFIIIQLLLAVFIAIKKLIKLKGIEKKKILIAILGLSIFGFSTTIINVVLPAFKIYIFYKKTIIFSLFFLIPTFYSFHKYRFFNISFISLEFLRNSILISFFLITAIAVNHALLYVLIPNINHIIIFMISIVIALYVWILLQKYFPHILTNDFTKFKKNINVLQSSIYSYEKFNDLQLTLEKYFVIENNIVNVKIFAVRNNFIDIELPIYVNDEFTKILVNFKNDLLINSEINYYQLSIKIKNILRSKMNEINADLCMPLFAEDNLIGFFILGFKDKNQLYTKEEINEIIKLRYPLQIFITNFLLKLNLQEENNLMKEIIEKKTESLRQQFNEIKILLEQQSDFIAVTAHELRTLLSIAMFQLEDTLKTYKHTPQVIKDMEIMGNSLKNLKILTQKLFEVQQYDLNKIILNKETVNLNEFLNQIFTEFSLIMKDNGIKFLLINNLLKDTEVDFDKYQIRQVITNLINNAIKFTNSENPTISLEVCDCENIIKISIIDNGSGIPDSDKKRIFEKFQTTDISIGTGIGLGLYICKKIIELHKSKIWAEDNEGGGTKFSFELQK